MKIRLFSICFVLLSLQSYGQISYEKGYFIGLDGQRIECLIKNYEWKNSPTEFEYKLTEGDQPQKATASVVKEFGILSGSKYIAADVKIDRSSEFLAELEHERNPQWLRERLFLKVLIDGKPSLLYYTASNLKRYFYQMSDTVKQLIYKKYLNEKDELMENSGFRQQLWAEFRCDNFSEAETKRLGYTKNELVNYFRKYFECSNFQMQDYTKSSRKSDFHLKLTPGINFSSLFVGFSANTKYYNLDVDYGTHVDFRMGLEGEFVLPYNKNKWALVVEPNYQSFNATSKDETKVARYNTFEIPMGVRYYMFLSPHSRIFVNGFFVYSVPSKSSSIQAWTYDFSISTPGKISAGAGFDFRKFSLEARYYRNGDILNDYVNFTAEYERWSFIMGYRLF